MSAPHDYRMGIAQGELWQNRKASSDPGRNNTLRPLEMDGQAAPANCAGVLRESAASLELEKRVLPVCAGYSQSGPQEQPFGGDLKDQWDASFTPNLNAWVSRHK
jgi:hypothetical protein